MSVPPVRPDRASRARRLAWAAFRFVPGARPSAWRRNVLLALFYLLSLLILAGVVRSLLG